MAIRLIATSALAFALCACSGQTKPAAETSDAPTTSSASSTSSAASASSGSSTASTSGPVAVPAKGEKPTREFVIGKWGTDGDCTLAIELRPDGTSDGPFGNWTYSDGVISFPEDPEFKVDVTVIDQNTMQSNNGNSGKTAQMTRCP